MKTPQDYIEETNVAKLVKEFLADDYFNKDWEAQYAKLENRIKEYGKQEYLRGVRDGESADGIERYQRGLKDGEEKGRNERDKQIISWFKIPIYPTEKGILDRIECPQCGDTLVAIRATNPKENPRDICATCAVEILESIVSSLYPNNQELSARHPKETGGDNK